MVLRSGLDSLIPLSSEKPKAVCQLHQSTISVVRPACEDRMQRFLFPPLALHISTPSLSLSLSTSFLFLLIFIFHFSDFTADTEIGERSLISYLQSKAILVIGESS
jgi:hypothetical protein